MPDQQLGFQRIGMVEVDLVALCGGEAIEVAVIGIVGDPLDVSAADAIVDGLGHLVAAQLSVNRAGAKPGYLVFAT